MTNFEQEILKMLRLEPGMVKQVVIILEPGALPSISVDMVPDLAEKAGLEPTKKGR